MHTVTSQVKGTYERVEMWVDQYGNLSYAYTITPEDS